MATPKKRTGKASQATRRANWKGTVPATTTCPNCKAIVLTHTVCPECGYYKDGFASKKAKENNEVKVEPAAKKTEAVEEKTEEPKKTRKPRAKKTETKTEVKTEEKSEAPAEEKDAE